MNWPTINKVQTIVFDFDGVFTDNGVSLSEDGKESIRCSRYDGFGITFLQKFIKKNNLTTKLMVLSKEPNPVVLGRTKKLKLECAHGVDDKLTFLKKYFTENNMEDGFSTLVYLGNDLNDLSVMRKANFSVAPSDAHPVIQKCASVVLPEKGGHGFVRNFVDTLLQVEALSLDALEELCL